MRMLRNLTDVQKHVYGLCSIAQVRLTAGGVMADPTRIHPKQTWLMDFACATVAVVLVLFLALAAGFALWSMFRS
jgi:hypothetical protein